MTGFNAATAAASTGSATANQGLGKYYAISQTVSALATLAGGLAGMKGANEEAAFQEAQASLLEEESQREAAQKAREVTRFQSLQAHRYASSGITLEGTPVQVLEETRRLGQEEVDAMLKQGKAQADLMRLKAKRTQSAGRSSMLGSLLTAGLTGVDGYIAGRRLGIYGTKSPLQLPPPPPNPAPRIR